MEIDKTREINVCVLGDSWVGKTTLIGKFYDEKFYDEYCATLGADYLTKAIIINEEKIKLKMYDTAGQERFRSIMRQFYRQTHGIILVFDLSCHQSFESLEEWLTEIKNNIINEYVEIILVGTKADLKNNREVHDDEIVHFSHEHKLQYIETSSKDNLNVDILFNTIAQNIINKMNNPLYTESFNNRNNNTLKLNNNSEPKNSSYLNFLSSCW
jgi:Ras-related protein Rab-35